MCIFDQVDALLKPFGFCFHGYVPDDQHSRYDIDHHLPIDGFDSVDQISGKIVLMKWHTGETYYSAKACAIYNANEGAD